MKHIILCKLLGLHWEMSNRINWNSGSENERIRIFWLNLLILEISSKFLIDVIRIFWFVHFQLDIFLL